METLSDSKAARQTTIPAEKADHARVEAMKWERRCTLAEVLTFLLDFHEQHKDSVSASGGGMGDARRPDRIESSPASAG